MLGWNQNVRNVPVSKSTTKLHSAISPSMNDQWSGNTLRICVRVAVAMPVRSSAQLGMPPMIDGLDGFAAVLALVLMRSASLPEARTYWFREVTRRDQVSLGVDRDGQLRERPRGGTEEHLAVVGQVERRLVARAQQVMGLLLPQGDGAADVGADLGIAEDPVDAPVLATLRGRDVVGVHPDEDDGGLGLHLQQLGALRRRLAVALTVEEELRLGVDELPDPQPLGLDGGPRDVVRDAHALAPDRVVELVARQRPEVAQQDDRGQEQRA